MALFPSPCGVLVLKLMNTTQNAATRVTRFRPLAGFWFLNTAQRKALMEEYAGFRPLAGFPYLSFPRRYGRSGEQCEPMGALVPCVHF